MDSEDMDSGYHVPKPLTVLAGIFLALGAVAMVVVTADILWRRGWKTMMLIMDELWPTSELVKLEANVRAGSRPTSSTLVTCRWLFMSTSHTGGPRSRDRSGRQ